MVICNGDAAGSVIIESPCEASRPGFTISLCLTYASSRGHPSLDLPCRLAITAQGRYALALPSLSPITVRGRSAILGSRASTSRRCPYGRPTVCTSSPSCLAVSGSSVCRVMRRAVVRCQIAFTRREMAVCGPTCRMLICVCMASMGDCRGGSLIDASSGGGVSRLGARPCGPTCLIATTEIVAMRRPSLATCLISPTISPSACVSCCPKRSCGLHGAHLTKSGLEA